MRANILPTTLDFSSTQLRSELAASYPLIKTVDRQMTVTGGTYFSRLRYDLNHTGLAGDRAIAGFAELSDTRQYSPAWSGSYTVRASFGGALPYSPPMPQSRANATTDFAKLDIGAALGYAIDENFNLLMRADAQAASGSLMAAEEVSYGGDRFGRGYDTGMVSGDHGLGVSLQPQYRFAPLANWEATAYLFGDFARVFNTRGDFQGRHRPCFGGRRPQRLP